MDGFWIDLALIAVLIVVNALFAGSELAIVSLREGQLRGLGRSAGSRGARLAELAHDPNRFLATIQVGITLAGFLASATAAVSLAEPLVPLLSFTGAAAEPLSVALVTVLLTFVTLVVGELAPKRLAMQSAERWALRAVTPLQILATVARPVIWALGRATDLTVRLLGGNPDVREQPLAREELREMVVAQHGLTPRQRRIIISALEFHERPLRTVLVPRREVFGLPDGMPAGEARTALAASGHSRAPVTVAGHMDDVLGVVHLRDLVTADDSASVTDRARPALRLPDVLRLTEALQRLMSARGQFALVIDEYGSVSGIVTLEDLLEAIVGEIPDDFGRGTSAVVSGPDGTLLLPGAFPLRDLGGVGVDLGDHTRAPYTTIGGLTLAVLGRVPDAPGDRVRVAGWWIEVTGVGHHAVTAVRLRPDRPHTPSEDGGATAY